MGKSERATEDSETPENGVFRATNLQLYTTRNVEKGACKCGKENGGTCGCHFDEHEQPSTSSSAASWRSVYPRLLMDPHRPTTLEGVPQPQHRDQVKS
ncbi:hypothetical protein Bca4012_056458 [Brassica carinata]